MNNTYCSWFYSSLCMSRDEWKFYLDSIVALITIFVGPIGLYKIFMELQRINRQNEKDSYDKTAAADLKRTEFFLNQHRRLFDDKDLYAVLEHIDGDDPELADQSFWDRKRKFLTFIEEMALLVESSRINSDVAYYMFGHYAVCAADGVNFKEGIALDQEYWALFYDFVEKARKYKKEGIPDLEKLKL